MPTGVKYKIIQPHRSQVTAASVARFSLTDALGSQSDWTPPATPALWGRIEGDDHNRSPHHEKSQWGEDCKCQPCAPSYDQPPQQQQQQQQQPYEAPQGGVTPTHEERQQHWYDIDDKRKKELEVCFLPQINAFTHCHLYQVGGGILAGVGALAAGYYAYKGHNKSEEEVYSIFTTT